MAETEEQCKARKGTLVRDPRTGKYLSCYPPPPPKPITDVVEKLKRQHRDRMIMLAIGAGLVFLAYNGRRRRR